MLWVNFLGVFCRVRSMSELVYVDDYMSVRCVVVSEMENNVFVLTSRADGVQVLVDAAADFEAVQAVLERALELDFVGSGNPVGLVAVLTTHGHWDHIRALPQVVKELSPVTFAGASDVDAIAEQEGVVIDRTLSGGEVLSWGGLSLQVISLRGHTPGSVAFVWEDPSDVAPTLLFTGDSLFPGGVGKTWSRDNFVCLLEEVSVKIFGEFDDSAVVLPGHGKFTTLGAERPFLAEWRARGW